MGTLKLNNVTAITESGGVVTLVSATVIPALDEDTMASDSATKVATQQSIKAYVDSGANTNPAVSTYDAYYVVVAGGGCGGGTSQGGGGGGGGYLTNYGGTAITLTVGQIYTCTIGAGGIGATSQGTNGSPSSLAGAGITTITTTGGGAGGGNGVDGNNGGSGGGSGAPLAGGNSTKGLASPAGQGNNGGNGHDGISVHTSTGGGGGAGTTGNHAHTTAANTSGATGGGMGGEGALNLITGSPIYYAGGGGGSCDWGDCNQYPLMGIGGGGVGQGGTRYGANKGNGTDGLGGGGGGGALQGESNYPNGGSGVIVLRVVHYSGITTGSPKVTQCGGGVTVLEFTGTGTYTA